MNSTFLNTLPKNNLSKDLELIFHDFQFMKIFQEYGSYCLVMSSLLEKILTDKGYEANIMSCNAILAKDGSNFHLGHKGYAKPGQIDAHFVCVVSDNLSKKKYLIDFAMVNIQKYFDPTFCLAIAIPVLDSTSVLGEIMFNEHSFMQWNVEEYPENLNELIAGQEPQLNVELKQLRTYNTNRVRFCVQHAFKKHLSALSTNRSYTSQKLNLESLLSNTH